MSSNDQYRHPPFGMSPAVGHSGAPGSMSPGSDADPSGTAAGPVIGTATLTTPLQTVQYNVPPQVDVHPGDTTAMTEVMEPSPLLGGPVSQYLDTGAGRGHTQMRHPNAGH
jgi:hypothetical protein